MSTHNFAATRYNLAHAVPGGRELFFLFGAGVGIFLVAALYCVLHGFQESPFRFDLATTLGWAVPRWGAWPLLLPACFWVIGNANRRGQPLVGLLLGAILAVAGVTLFAAVYQLGIGKPANLVAVTYYTLPMTLATFALAALFAYFLLQTRSDARPDRSSEASQESPVLTVSKGALETQLAVAKIEYARAARNYVELSDGSTQFIRRSSLAALEQTLPRNEFLRVHRSYLVRRACIDGVVGGRRRPQLVMSSGNRIPVGKTYRHSVNGTLRDTH